MKNVLVLCVFLILASYSFGQKQVLTHDVYDNWKDLKEFKLSYKGDYSSYQLNPQKGDGLLLLVENATGKTVKSFARGQNNTFSLNSDFLVFRSESVV